MKYTCDVGNYIGLCSTAIAMAGLLLVFLSLRWTSMDNYVDNRKTMLRSLLATHTKASVLLPRIQSIGKPGEDSVEFFGRFRMEAVDEFVKDIIRMREMRKRVNTWGLILIAAWVGLGLFYLALPYFSNCTSGNKPPILVILTFTPITIFSLLFGCVCLIPSWFHNMYPRKEIK